MAAKAIPLFLLLAVVPAVIVGQRPAETVVPHDKLDSVLWVQTAAEHDAAYLQAYAAARRSLDVALKDKKWTAAIEQISGFEHLPPAIILDVDETVLDNSPEEAAVITRNVPPTSAIWDEWVKQERANALPGAVAFTNYARSKKVEVFYVTNRGTQSKEMTRTNLARAGFPLHEGMETIYCLGDRPEWGVDKGPRRAAVAQRYRVLLLLGDDLGDFLSAVRVTPDERRRMVTSHASYWGERWIILPNPMYGSWAGSLYGFDTSLSTAQQLRRKRQYLVPMK